jgi:proton-dependent oligopeptide transporter, POT family
MLDVRSAFSLVRSWLFAQVAVPELRAESIGELLIMPIGYAMISKLAPKQYQGVMMGAGSLAVGIVLVVLIPFLRKLITDKAETAPAVAPTPAGPAAAAV